ncbi:MAG: GTP 3',8-cyclase MoaA [Planctomycetota bacterium]
MRVSVTSRCDLDCVYCNAPGAPDAEAELSAGEIALVAEAAALAGATRIRLTGGEPLLRDDIVEIVSRLDAPAGANAMEIALTTNAQALAACASELKAAGLDRVNIGLPSLDTDRYRRLTGGDLASVLEGLDAALRAGLEPVKLNVVVTHGGNEGEIPDFVCLARERPVEVRFIERMPFAGGDGLLPAPEIREAIAAALRGAGLGDARLGAPDLSPTAELYRPEGFAGAVGVIPSVTEPFCARCDRLRVTSSGVARSCLSEPGGTDLRALIRSGAGAEDLARELEAAFGRKPARHSASFSGSMREIGG